MSETKVVLASLSAAMDGGFTAIADVSRAMASAGADGHYRLIGGVTVMLHIQRLGLDLPLRATGDADFGVPPHVLRRPDLVDAIERVGYHKVFGNRWERQLANAVSLPSTYWILRTVRALATRSRLETS